MQGVRRYGQKVGRCPANRRWRAFDYAELLKRDKLSLDLFWLKDKSLTDTDALPEPQVLALEIADELEAALLQFNRIAARLTRDAAT